MRVFHSPSLMHILDTSGSSGSTAMVMVGSGILTLEDSGDALHRVRTGKARV